MLTRNYDHIMERLLTGYNAALPSASDRSQDNWLTDKYMLLKDNGGVICTLNPTTVSGGIFGYGSDSFKSVNAGNTCLLVGSSDAEETYDDYTLDFITTLFVQGVRALTYEYKADGMIVHTNKVFVNNTAEDIIVKEIGVFTGFSGYVGSSSSMTARNALTYRKKLDEPITIPANGGVANIALDITIPAQNKPNA